MQWFVRGITKPKQLFVVNKMSQLLNLNSSYKSILPFPEKLTTFLGRGRLAVSNLSEEESYCK